MTTQGKNGVMKTSKKGKFKNKDLKKGLKSVDDILQKMKDLKKEKDTVLEKDEGAGIDQSFEQNVKPSEEILKKKKKKEKSVKKNNSIKKNEDKPNEENVRQNEEVLKKRKRKKEKQLEDDTLTNKTDDTSINQSPEGNVTTDDNEVAKRKKIKKDKKKKNKLLTEISTENGADQSSKKSENDDEGEEKEENKKKKPSIRQMKREKAMLRAEQAVEASKQENAKKALNYVSKWKHARSEWKFEKLKQIWLMDNLLNDKYIPDDHFPVILDYFDGCKGFARKTLVDKAMKVIKKIEDTVEEDEEIVETTEYKRARQLLQALPMEA